MPKLTKRFVDAVKIGVKDVIHWDDELPRFGLRVKPSGAMTFVLQYRNAQGRTRRLALGRVGELTPDQARIKARRLRQAVRDGSDPSATRREGRADPTIGELAERYLSEAPADKPSKKASSWATDASNLRRHVVPDLGQATPRHPHHAGYTAVPAGRDIRQDRCGRQNETPRSGDRRGRAGHSSPRHGRSGSHVGLGDSARPTGG